METPDEPAGGRAAKDEDAISGEGRTSPCGSGEPGERRPISEAQAEARRRNGAKSRGPVTDRGKQASRQNAVRHGAYSKTLGVVTRGVLMEDEHEAELLFDIVIGGFAPETELDCLLAEDIAIAM